METTHPPTDAKAGSTDAPELDTAAKRVAAEIRGLMGAKNLTPADLANHLGVHRWTAALRIKGEKDLSIDEVVSIAAWLDVPATRLFNAAAGLSTFSA